MGSLHAQEFASAVADKRVALDQALTWHLTVNHYPPLPLSILPAVKRAITQAKKGNWTANIRLPKGVSWRGQTKAPVHECVKAWHLDAFIQTEEDDDE